MGSSLSIAPGRRERQKLEREQKILAAARRLFDRRGYIKTSMEDVARRAGLAVGTLYNYFSSKDQLLVALSRSDTERLLSIGERILADPPDDPVEAIAFGYLGGAAEDPRLRSGACAFRPSRIRAARTSRPRIASSGSPGCSIWNAARFARSRRLVF